MTNPTSRKPSAKPTAQPCYGREDLQPLLSALNAAVRGDFSVRLSEGEGLLGDLASAFNAYVSINSAVTDEITRVGRVVGREGRMTERATMAGATGAWATKVDSINNLISDLRQPTTEVARVITAVANGDLSQKMALEIEGVPVKGEFLRIGTTVNRMVDQLSSFASEVTRVAREVGTEGKLGGQANVAGVAGTWKDLTDNVNGLAGNLTNQVRNIAKVTTAVANGDLSQKITVDASGEILELKDTINTMVDQLSSFASEVTRVAREVGTEGRLGGQANVKGVSGTWKDLTDNVNVLAGNLTVQLRDVSKVATAIANGDLTQKITVDVRGEILQIKDVINKMVDQLSGFAAEVTRVAKEVGTEGKLGGQADVRGVSGTWKDLTDNVNGLAGNLTNQVRNIALVTTAVANGDLSQKITVDARGEILELKDTVNTMVDQLRSFASEVTRVAREVGTEGKLGGQAEVRGVSGTWKDLTDSVNGLAGNLTDQVRNIALVTTAVANGDLSRKITVDVKGEILELKNTINTMVDQLRSFSDEVTRVAREVGTEGKLGGQADVKGVSGTWKDLTDNVNSMASNLTNQVRNIALVTTAVANGDLSKKITVDVKGEILELKNTINTMVDQLRSFASEVTRVAREVGTEGKLGGQAAVEGVAGTWKDLTDNVNFMGSNLTAQVRNIATVTTAVAMGDLGQKITVDARGEILELKNTINTMVDQLSSFASEVTRVAREVGTEGKLGGQARVPGVDGTWKDLTDNVNFMASTLTAQVRAISEVATAVTQGDLTRSIAVEAQGEVLELKDNINRMIGNLRETTEKNQEQDWLKTNLAKFSGMMQGQKSLESVSRLIMSELTPLVGAHHGAFFIADDEGTDSVMKLIASYAYRERKNLSNRFKLGEGVVGQSALEKKSILLTGIPEDYIRISSGLGEAAPRTIIVLPVLFEGEVKAVVELASFQPFSQIHRIFLDQLSESLGVVLNMIEANMRTELLLQQSQSLTQELQSQSLELQNQQGELRRSNGELEEKAALLEEQNRKVEIKNREVELARMALEEKAEQLALASKYKSEFLANMSHELRTPLNSLLILAKLLADNKDSNLSLKQVEFANTIYTSGLDLLNLINEILDLAKVESGKMDIDLMEVSLAEVGEFAQRNFRPVAAQKGLGFEVVLDPAAPRSLRTDSQRLQQILKNLLSNAMKFTEEGRITFSVQEASGRNRFASPTLAHASRVVAFSVSDTGIGIPKDKQQLIFEAFQQADGTTSRKYGGTGLGLSISRELARLLGGEIHVESVPGQGSTFTLYLPDTFVAPDEGRASRTLEAFTRDQQERRATSVPAEALAPEPIALASIRPVESVGPRVELGEDLAPVLSGEIIDDRDEISEGDSVLLIIENDVNFAQILLAMARERGFKGIVAVQGDTGLALAHEFRPDAITLDIRLPMLDGWAVLDRLKRHPDTRHIPVQIISVEDNRQRGISLGAVAYLEKPVSKEALEGAFAHINDFIARGVRSLLVVEDNQESSLSIRELVGDEDVQVTVAATGEAALAALASQEFDCMVLDLGLPGMSGFELLERVKADPRTQNLPVIVYTGRELTRKEEAKLKSQAESVILKGSSGSPDQLLDETALFLHRVVDRLPDEKRVAVQRLHDGDDVLAGKTVLVVDDDVRNIFALSSALEEQGLKVLFAENGREGIDTLNAHPEVSLVLMDVMMPGMDGYETTRAIRRQPEYRTLPIVALTAKAMKGDREKCTAAGASDYIAKPVDTAKLLAKMRVWLSTTEAAR